MRLKSAEKHDSKLIIEFLKDQIQMLEDPIISIDPLDYLKLQLQIEQNRLNRLNAQI
jgi:hypothetical protein